MRKHVMGVEFWFLLEFVPVVACHNLPANKVCADGKYVRLSGMQARDTHFFIERPPSKAIRGESCTE
jgi:hypothetical protein